MKKICLIVDDLKENREIASSYFLSMGFDVEFAKNGIEALAKLICKRYHIVLMDYEMPWLNGLKATKRYRSWEKLIGVKQKQWIYLFSTSEQLVLKSIQKNGLSPFSGNLKKPINFNEVMRIFNHET